MTRAPLAGTRTPLAGTRAALAGLLVLSLGGTATAETPSLDRPDAFERGFAVSLYRFDACGDQLAGRMFRHALAERFAQCPFTPEARSRYQQRTRAQQAKAQATLQGMVESLGGLPMRLDGMTMTCHEQRSTTDYQQLRDRLEQHSQGKLPADAIVTAPCDAADMSP